MKKNNPLVSFHPRFSWLENQRLMAFVFEKGNINTVWWNKVTLWFICDINQFRFNCKGNIIIRSYVEEFLHCPLTSTKLIQNLVVFISGLVLLWKVEWKNLVYTMIQNTRLFGFLWDYLCRVLYCKRNHKRSRTAGNRDEGLPARKPLSTLKPLSLS